MSTRTSRGRLPLVVLAALLAAGCVAKSQFVSKSQEAERLAGDLARERQRVGDLAVRAAQLETRLAETERSLEAAIKERDALRVELTEARTRAARLTGQLAEATDQRDTLARQLDIAQQSASRKDVSLQQVTYRYDDLVKDLERQKGELAKRATDLGAQLAAADGRVKGLAAERDTLTAERLRLDTRLREMDAELTAARQRLGDSHGELAAARQRLADTQAELASTRQRLGETRAELEARERKLAEATATYDRLVKDLKGEIADGQVKITQLRDRLTVNLVDKILFDSGSIAINPKGQQVLKKVAEVLRPITDKRIQIEGHTDNVPISPSLKGRFPTNWELSVARATVVARFLQDQGGIEPARLLATGYGEYHPVGGNETLEGRAQNRRIEIVLVPDVSETAQR